MLYGGEIGETADEGVELLTTGYGAGVAFCFAGVERSACQMCLGALCLEQGVDATLEDTLGAGEDGFDCVGVRGRHGGGRGGRGGVGILRVQVKVFFWKSGGVGVGVGKRGREGESGWLGRDGDEGGRGVEGVVYSSSAAIDRRREIGGE